MQNLRAERQDNSFTTFITQRRTQQVLGITTLISTLLTTATLSTYTYNPHLKHESGINTLNKALYSGLYTINACTLGLLSYSIIKK